MLRIVVVSSGRERNPETSDTAQDEERSGHEAHS